MGICNVNNSKSNPSNKYAAKVINTIINQAKKSDSNPCKIEVILQKRVIQNKKKKIFMEKIFLMLIVFLSSCNNSNRHLMVSPFECQFLFKIPIKNYSPYNVEFIHYNSGERFEIRKIEKYNREYFLDSVFIIKSEDVLSYSTMDLNKDAQFKRSENIIDRRIPYIYKNKIIENGDTLNIVSQNESSYLVKDTCSKCYRLYKKL